MAQNITIHGKHITLQSATIRDSKRIFHIRNHGENSAYLHKSSEEVHNLWLEDQIEQDQDYYFCIVNNKSKEIVGTIGLYNFGFKNAEWGRWVVIDDPLAALESIVLLFEFAFNLKIRELFCRVSVENIHTLRLHDGLDYTRVLANPDETLYFLDIEQWKDFEKAYRQRFRLDQNEHL